MKWRAAEAKDERVVRVVQLRVKVVVVIVVVGVIVRGRSLVGLLAWRE